MDRGFPFIVLMVKYFAGELAENIVKRHDNELASGWLKGADLWKKADNYIRF
jgi:hypothetical protein